MKKIAGSTIADVLVTVTIAGILTALAGIDDAASNQIQPTGIARDLDAADVVWARPYRFDSCNGESGSTGHRITISNTGHVSVADLTCRGTSRDHAIAREAYRRAATWFAARGYISQKPITITFAPEVHAPVHDPSLPQGGTERVYGYYSQEEDIIYMSSFGTSYVVDRGVYNTLDNSEEAHVSVLVHEIAHKLFRDTNENAHLLGRAAHELMAYVVQIDTMAPASREKVLTLWPGEEFTNALQVNTIIWGFNPHRFGVLGYRFFTEKLLREFYEGINPDAVNTIL